MLYYNNLPFHGKPIWSDFSVHSYKIQLYIKNQPRLILLTEGIVMRRPKTVPAAPNIPKY